MWTALAGALAGTLGALLGVGGRGSCLCSSSNLALDCRFATATGISLVAVICTSLAVSAAPSGAAQRNNRLTLLMQFGTVLGAIAGSELHRLGLAPDSLARRLFAATAAIVAVALIMRLDRRNILPAGSVEVGRFDGHFFDHDTATAWCIECSGCQSR